MVQHAVKLDQVQVELGVPGVAKIGAEFRGIKPADTADSAPQRAMRELGEDAAGFAANHDRHGLVLFLDELHDAPVADRRALLHSVQTWDAEGVRVAAVGAGLPSLPVALTQAATFGERSDFHEVAPLTDQAVQDGLTGPASRMGVTWTPEALTSAVQYVQGYPYSVQMLGSTAWLEARPTADGAVIEYTHAVAARNRVADRMTDLYQARLSRLTDAEHAFVTVMAELGGRDVARADIAVALGLESRSISRTRERLLAKGMIADTAHGRLSFTVPGLDVHLRTQRSADQTMTDTGREQHGDQ